MTLAFGCGSLFLMTLSTAGWFVVLRLLVRSMPDGKGRPDGGIRKP